MLTFWPYGGRFSVRRRMQAPPNCHCSDPPLAVRGTATEAAYKGPVADPFALEFPSSSLLRATGDEMADAHMMTEDDYGYPGKP